MFCPQIINCYGVKDSKNTPNYKRYRGNLFLTKYGKCSFSVLYSYLDSLQPSFSHAHNKEDSSDDEIDMQKYIKPVRTMLGHYKQSINELRDNQMILSKSTEGSENENICPNRSTTIKSKTKGRERDTNRLNTNITMKMLDDEISELTRKLCLK